MPLQVLVLIARAHHDSLTLTCTRTPTRTISPQPYSCRGPSFFPPLFLACTMLTVTLAIDTRSDILFTYGFLLPHLNKGVVCYRGMRYRLRLDWSYWHLFRRLLLVGGAGFGIRNCCNLVILRTCSDVGFSQDRLGRPNTRAFSS